MHGEVLDVFTDGVEFFLFLDADAFGLVVLLLDAGELGGDFTDFFLVVLHGGGVVGWFEEGVGFDVGFGAIV